jgi:hypothetical protein
MDEREIDIYYNIYEFFNYFYNLLWQILTIQFITASIHAVISITALKPDPISITALKPDPEGVLYRVKYIFSP